MSNDPWQVVIILTAFFVFLLFKQSKIRRCYHTLNKPKPGTIIKGRAYITDGDGLRVRSMTIRLTALDAPEWDQPAKGKNGYWFQHGKFVKSKLITAFGGKQVQVKVEDYDRYGRILGTATCYGRDIGQWLVQEGYAIAAYDSRYRQTEAEARAAKRGMWGYAISFDPRAWRAGHKVTIQKETRQPKRKSATIHTLRPNAPWRNTHNM